MRSENDHNVNIMRYVWSIWEYQGKDLNMCELCGEATATPEVHHTKYDGATLDDLVIACRKCQMQPENVGLK